MRKEIFNYSKDKKLPQTFNEHHHTYKVSDVSDKLKSRVLKLSPRKKSETRAYNRCWGFGFLKVDGKEIY